MSKPYKTPLGYSFPLSLRILTPVHIGNGQDLSPLTDYYLTNGKIHLLDQEKFSELIYHCGEVENFIRSVEAVTDQSKEYLIKSFTKNHLKLDLDTLPVKSSLASYGVQNPLVINECIKTDEKPYLPGSSLKGAIRSSLLFNWLTQEEDTLQFEKAQAALSDWLKFLNNTTQQIEVSKNKYNRNKAAKEIATEFEKKIEEGCFESLRSKQRMALSDLKLSDSNNIIKDEAIAVYACDRYHLHWNERTIGQLKECLVPDLKLSLKISLEYQIKINENERYHPIIKCISNPKDLFRVINQYSKSVLEYEIVVLNSKNSDSEIIDDLVVKLEELRDKIDDSSDNYAYIRLGQGKMQFYQSIAIVLFEKFGRDEEANAWVDYLEYTNSFKEVTDPYPITRELTTLEGLPMGWIELKLMDN